MGGLQGKSELSVPGRYGQGQASPREETGCQSLTQSSLLELTTSKPALDDGVLGTTAGGGSSSTKPKSTNPKDKIDQPDHVTFTNYCYQMTP